MHVYVERSATRKLNGVHVVSRGAVVLCSGEVDPLIFTVLSLCFFAGGQCGCSSYSTLLYALSSAVAVLLLLLFVAFVMIYQVSGHNVLL